MTSELKRQIIEKIDQVLLLDFAKLYPNNPEAKSWNNMTPEGVEQLTLSVLGLLKDVKDSSLIIDNLTQLDARSFDQQLKVLINSYSDSGLNNLNYNQITTQHHGAISNLYSLHSLIKTNGIYVDLSVLKKAESILNQKINDFSKAEDIANTLAKKSIKIEESITSAEKWLSTRQDINGKTIEEQAEAFYEMANEHKVFRGWSGVKNSPKSFKEKLKRFSFEYNFGGSWFWLFLTLTFAVLTGWVTYEFIIKAATTTQDTKDIKVGAALLRIAGLIVPGYLTLFSSNQFLYHKRLYDNYMFKYSAMKTMNNLVSVHKEQGERVLDKGLDILFTEPRTKESSGKYDPQLINELVKMLRDQINK